MQGERATDTTSAPHATPSHVTTPATDDDVAARQQRLAALRAASRLLAPSLAPADARRVESFAAELHDQLAILSDPLRSASAALLDDASRDREAQFLASEVIRLDTALDQLSRSLRLMVDEMAPERLRSSLGDCGTERRDDAVALLDVLLEDEARIGRRLDVTLSLVVWASSEAQDGHRRVVRDPATLTPRLRAFAERCATAADADLARAEQDFIAAARRWEAAPDADVVDEMNARKAALGVALFAPGLLRAVVFYEARIARVDALRNEAAIGPPAPEAAETQHAPESASPTAWAAVHSSRAELPTPPPVRRVTAPVSSASLASAAADPSDVRWRIHDAPPEAPRVPAEPGKMRRAITHHWKSAVSALGTAALLALAAHVWWGHTGDVRDLSKTDLGAVSASLVSAYRDDGGKGSLFIGTVGPEWTHHSVDARERDAKNIVAKLQRTGVREVLLYDGARRVAVHHAEGLPLQIGP